MCNKESLLLITYFAFVFTHYAETELLEECLTLQVNFSLNKLFISTYRPLYTTNVFRWNIMESWLMFLYCMQKLTYSQAKTTICFNTFSVCSIFNIIHNLLSKTRNVTEKSITITLRHFDEIHTEVDFVHYHISHTLHRVIVIEPSKEIINTVKFS